MYYLTGFTSFASSDPTEITNVQFPNFEGNLVSLQFSQQLVLALPTVQQQHNSTTVKYYAFTYSYCSPHPLPNTSLLSTISVTLNECAGNRVTSPRFEEQAPSA